MELTCNYLFIEEEKTLHPLTLKIDLPPTSIKSLSIPRMEYAASLSLEHLVTQPKQNDKFIIVGTGPTLNLNRLSEGKICTVNKAHDYLIKNGIVPDMHIIYENDVHDIEQSLGGPPHKDVIYYICSVNYEGIFDQLKDYKVVLWHTKFLGDEYKKFVESLFPDEPNVDGPPISFVKAIGIGRALGYKNFGLHGIDCSFPFSGSDHVNGRMEEEAKLLICGKSKANEYRRYSTSGSYMYQIIEFMKYSKIHKDINIKVYGEGLLGFVYA